MLEKHASGRERLSIAGPVLRCMITVVLAAVVAISTTTLITNAAAAEPRKVEFNIPAQPIASALRTYARQAKVQLLVLTEGLNAIQANEVVGRLDPRTALQMLLDGTGLQAEYRPDSTVAVGRKSDAEGPVASSGYARDGHTGFLAQAKPAAGEGTGAEDSEGQRTALSDFKDARSPADDIEEIVVVGSNIRGVGAVGGFSITFTQDELAKTGYSTLGELFESLPQNLNEMTPRGGVAEGTSRIAGSNSQQATGISLRGLGPGSTLVLLNGKRRPGNVFGRVFDVSAIPLSMVERVEVLTGGRSGIYGSDAVAGVVNIVTVKELDGAESQVYYGGASAGGERITFSQTVGRAIGDGGFVLGYVYRKARPLDATDAGVVRGPSALGITPIKGLFHLRNASEQHVGLFSGHHELGRNVEFYADAHFSSRTNESRTAYNFLSVLDFGGTTITESDQYSAAGGVRLDAGEKWQIDLSALYGVVDNTWKSAVFSLPSGGLTNFDVVPISTTVDDDTATLSSFSAIADGPLGNLWNATISAAVGIDFRNEDYQRTSRGEMGTTTPREGGERDIRSAFAEMHASVIDDGEQRLELSLAGRYDHYSDVGGTFNPQLGLEWSPTDGLTIRSSYATAFRAPDLFTLALGNQVFVEIVEDPLAADGTATQLTNLGGNPGLEPEKADTWTVGIDWQPSRGTELSVSYFRVDYRNRIGIPTDAHRTALQEESLYPGLIDRNPAPEQLDAILDRQAFFFNGTAIPFDPESDEPLAAFPDLVLFDNRRNNIALETIDGLDVQASKVLETRSGDWSFALNGTYNFDYVRNITVAAPPISRLNQPGRLVDLRLRGSVGWSKAAWSFNTYLNYVDDYVDTLAVTPTEIESWKTVDMTLSYDFPGNVDSGFLHGLEATLGVNNVLDEDPPEFLGNTFSIAYDPANANAIGRYVSLRVRKRW